MGKSRSPFMQSRTDGGTGPLVLSDPRRFRSGNIWFVQSVNSNAGDSVGKGQTPDAPFATIDYAIGQCTADQGDLIIVLPGHVETIVAAAGVALDVAGVSILGVGEGRQRPKVNFTTLVGASFDISAARCTVEGLWFLNSIDAQTAMINVSAADVSILNNEIQTGDAATQTLIGILTTASASRLRIEGNHIHGLVTAGTTSQIAIVGGDSIVIKNNILIGACATTGNISAGTTASLNGVIQGNLIQNQTADGNNKTIVLGAGDTYLIADNRMAVIDSTSPAPVTAAGAFVSGNYFTGATGVTASTLM